MAQRAPIGKAVFLCDDVVRDAAKNKTSVLNMFDTVRLDAGTAFPYHLRKLCVFAECTDGLGEFALFVEIERADTEEVVYRSAFQSVTFTDPLKSVKICFRLGKCVFPEPGDYTVQLFGDRDMIGDHMLHIVA